ncbi:MAG: DUF3124 domain-containing protein [Cryomorphaceae bacterium]
MKLFTSILMLALLLQGCAEEAAPSSTHTNKWSKRTVKQLGMDSLVHGSTYLSIYSEIYSQTEHRTHDLTATVSMRNTHRADTLYIQKAEFFDTKGNLIRTYFDQPIYIAPLETVEIVIDQTDQTGGTGANFLFDWSILPSSNEPLFEGVMISTSGQQGISFTTHGIRIH